MRINFNHFIFIMDHQSKKLPIIKIFTQAIMLPYKHFQSLMQFALPLISIQLILILSGTDRLTSVFKEITPESNVTGMDVLGFIIYLLILVMTVISCHRTFLLDEDSIFKTKILRWEIRELRYVGWAIVIGIILFILQLALGIIIMFFVGVKNIEGMMILGIALFLLI